MERDWSEQEVVTPSSSSQAMAAAPRTVKTDSVPALERGLQILEYLARSQHGLTHSQVTRRLGLPRSSCHALLRTFQRCGWAERDKKTGRYRLGRKLFGLANTALAGIKLRDQAAPVLNSLMQKTGLTAHLAVLEEGEAVLVERVVPPGTPKMATWIGKRMGLHCTALGKALVAYLPEGEVAELVRKQGMIKHNENTITTMRKLRHACETVRQLSYAVDEEEEEIGIRCIGAPVFDGERKVVAAISISGTNAQVENISRLAMQVKDAAKDLADRLSAVDQKPELREPPRSATARRRHLSAL